MAMTYLPARALLLFVATLLASQAHSLDLGSFKVASLTYGVNSVDFGPTETRGTVVLGWRENFNAHGFGVATFYLVSPRDKVRGLQTADMLGLVTVWDDVRDAKEALTVTTSGGADWRRSRLPPAGLEREEAVPPSLGRSQGRRVLC